jgi:MoaA/NifB/PqqE/SkfB family radical SAM enzyme
MVALRKARRLSHKILENHTAVLNWAIRRIRRALPRIPQCPSVIYLAVNNQCNYFCRFCDVGRANRERRRISSDFVNNLLTKDIVPLQTWKALIDDVSKFKPLIAITSTEPLLYPKIFELIDYIHSKGMEVWITTNGSLLPYMAPKLLEAKLDRLFVSIDGPPETHDKLRGVKGAFNHAMEGIKYMMDSRSWKKPYISLNYVICDQNYSQLTETIKFVRRDEITFSHLNFVTRDMAYLQCLLTPYPATPTSISEIQLDRININILNQQCEELRKLNGEPIININISPDLDREGLERHYKRPLQPHRYMTTCRAMTNVGQILADGSVTVSTRCPSTIRFGNITEKPFTEIWRGESFRSFRKYMSEIKLMPVCMRCCGAL